MNLPSPTPRPWYSKRWPVAILSSGPTLIATGVAALKAHIDPETNEVVAGMLIGIVGWSFLVVCLNIAKAHYEDTQDGEKHSPTHIETSLKLLRACVLIHKKRCGCTETDLRITVHAHRNPGKSAYLEQVVNYAGDDRSNRGAGRRMSPRSGIAGRVVRTGEVARVHLPAGMAIEEYRKTLVQEGGFTAEESETVSSGKISSIAIPLRNGSNKVIGCLYADSAVENYFDDDTAELLIVSTLEIATHA